MSVGKQYKQGYTRCMQDTPAAPAKEPKAGAQAALARLIKELGQEADPLLKEAARPRRKALKAVLQALQSAGSSTEDRTQLLLKTLVAQVTHPLDHAPPCMLAARHPGPTPEQAPATAGK